MIDRMNLVVDRRQHGVFAPEPRERKHTRQRQAADEKRGVRVGHEPPEAAELAHVDHAAHGVHHAASAEEQQGLKKRVREQVIHSAGHARECPRAERQEHVAELANRRIGEHSLEIELRERDEPRQERRETADCRDD